MINEKNDVRLIDFGLATKYRDDVDKIHFK